MDLRSIFQTLSNQRFVVAIVLVAGIVIAAAAALFVHGSYAATASVLLVPSNEQTSAGENPTTSTKPLLSTDLPTLAQTSVVLSRVAHELGNSADATQTGRRIRTDVYTNSNVMTIRFIGRSPQQARLGANAVANEVVNYYRTIATTRFDSLAADLKHQLAVRQSEIRNIDAQVQRLTAEYPYIEDGAGGSDNTTINARLVRLQSERDDLVAALSGDRAQQGVTSERTEEAGPLAREQVANADPSYVNVLLQYGRDSAELRRQQTHFAPNYPGLSELRDIVSKERSGIAYDKARLAGEPLAATQPYAEALAEENHARALVANDTSKLQRIDATIAELQRELTDSSSRGTAVDALRRERASAEAAYQLLSSRLSLTLADRAAAASTGSLMVYDRPSFASRTPYTNPAVIIGAVMFAAIWLAITLAFVFESLDHRFNTVSAIESVYGSPVLGVTG